MQMQLAGINDLRAWYVWPRWPSVSPSEEEVDVELEELCIPGRQICILVRRLFIKWPSTQHCLPTCLGLRKSQDSSSVSHDGGQGTHHPRDPAAHSSDAAMRASSFCLLSSTFTLAINALVIPQMIHPRPASSLARLSVRDPDSLLPRGFLGDIFGGGRSSNDDKKKNKDKNAGTVVVTELSPDGQVQDITPEINDDSTTQASVITL